MSRKLIKREVMMVSKILNRIKFRNYVNDLMSEKIDRILGMKENKNVKMGIVMADLSAYIIENAFIAEKELDSLTMSYKEIDSNTLESMDIDEYIDTLKEIFMAGIPKVISSFVDLNTVKKKMMDLKADLPGEEQTETK